MHRLSTPIIVLLLFICTQGRSQVFPRQQSRLHHTRVYFEEKRTANAKSYRLVLSDTTTFSRQKEMTGPLPAFWMPELEWGRTYFWKIEALDEKGNSVTDATMHTFSVVPKYHSKYYEETRLRVIRNKVDKHNKGYVCLDFARTIYDREGKAVWTVPDVEGFVDHESQIRDLKITKDNTVTFLVEKGMALEMDLSGNILWKAPFPFILGKDTFEYHHDLRKTTRGTYMVLGNKKVYRKIKGDYKKERLLDEYGIKMTDSAFYKIAEISAVLEFDKEGKLKWMWDADKYLGDADLNFKRTANGLPNFSTHMNAFSENAAGTKVYAGFRDVSRIIRIDKKTGTVDLSYGEKYPSGAGKFANELFRNQHDANVTTRNSIYVFNNNGLRSGGVSSVLELRDNLRRDTLPVWQFALNFDTLSSGKSVRGGNVQELPGRNLLVCGGQLNRVFEVTRAKEVVWDAFVEARGIKDTLWQPFPQYRASWVKELKDYYFLSRVLNNELTNDKTITIEINNTGNSEDQYVINVYKAGGILLESLRTPLVGVNRSTLCKPHPEKVSGYSYITVSSANDPYRIVQLMKE